MCASEKAQVSSKWPRGVPNWGWLYVFHVEYIAARHEGVGACCTEGRPLVGTAAPVRTVPWPGRFCAVTEGNERTGFCLQGFQGQTT